VEKENMKGAITPDAQPRQKRPGKNAAGKTERCASREDLRAQPGDKT